MSAGYTKGPWRVSKRAARRVTNETGVVICNAVLRNRGGPKQKRELKDEHEAEANAQLIASAPDLLEAAQRVLAGLNARIEAADRSAVPVFDGIADLHDAIARATGEQP